MKYFVFIVFYVLAVLPAISKEDVIVDVEFRAPVFCKNHRNSISYLLVSLNVDSFSRVTDLAYFTDGYLNSVAPDFYSASRVTTLDNEFRVELKKLVGPNAFDFGPQKNGVAALCTVKLSKGWRRELKLIQGVEIFETGDFEVECSFPLDPREMCSTSRKLAKNLFLNNPADGKKLRYESKFVYKTWKQPR